MQLWPSAGVAGGLHVRWTVTLELRPGELELTPGDAEEQELGSLRSLPSVCSARDASCASFLRLLALAMCRLVHSCESAMMGLVRTR